MSQLSEERKQNMSKASAARNEAVRELISKHESEYEELHRAKRKDRGLPENWQGRSRGFTRMTAMKGEVERLRALIEELGGDPGEFNLEEPAGEAASE